MNILRFHIWLKRIFEANFLSGTQFIQVKPTKFLRPSFLTVNQSMMAMLSNNRICSGLSSINNISYKCQGGLLIGSQDLTLSPLLSLISYEYQCSAGQQVILILGQHQYDVLMILWSRDVQHETLLGEESCGECNYICHNTGLTAHISLKILKQFTLHPAAEEFSVGESWFYCDDPLSIGD